MPALVFREGQLAGFRYDVAQEMSVGRENAAITLQDAEVSRRHAVVRPVEGGVEVQDVESTNGTWVNDRRIGGPTVVRPGDVLRLGPGPKRSTSPRLSRRSNRPRSSPPPKRPSPSRWAPRSSLRPRRSVDGGGRPPEGSWPCG
jgi:pSer/pThr/pTyr-binding forkhead associated (FHA) protein